MKAVLHFFLDSIYEAPLCNTIIYLSRTTQFHVYFGSFTNRFRPFYCKKSRQNPCVRMRIATLCLQQERQEVFSTRYSSRDYIILLWRSNAYIKARYLEINFPYSENVFLHVSWHSACHDISHLLCNLKVHYWSQQWQFLIQLLGLAEWYKATLCNLLPDMTSKWGFAIGIQSMPSNPTTFKHILILSFKKLKQNHISTHFWEQYFLF